MNSFPESRSIRNCWLHFSESVDRVKNVFVHWTTTIKNVSLAKRYFYDYSLFYKPQGLKEVIKIMEESWDEDPEARLTAANIVSRLETLERTQRKEELVRELELSSPHQTTASVQHKKVRVSSSFSGQPHHFPAVQRTRLSVGNADLSNNTVLPCQRYQRRASLTQHFELTENSDAMSGHHQCSSQFSPCDVVVSLTETFTPQSNEQDTNVNETPLNIDAATGQPSALNGSATNSDDLSNDHVSN